LLLLPVIIQNVECAIPSRAGDRSWVILATPAVSHLYFVAFPKIIALILAIKIVVVVLVASPFAAPTTPVVAEFFMVPRPSFRFLLASAPAPPHAALAPAKFVATAAEFFVGFKGLLPHRLEPPLVLLQRTANGVVQRLVVLPLEMQLLSFLRLRAADALLQGINSLFDVLLFLRRRPPAAAASAAFSRPTAASAAAAS
jgi:hypothetical protein